MSPPVECHHPSSVSGRREEGKERGKEEREREEGREREGRKRERREGRKKKREKKGEREGPHSWLGVTDLQRL